jgi:Regulator of ribonuclease activity B
MTTSEHWGDEITAAREIEHWVYSPDAIARGRFLARLDVLGFTVQALWDAATTTGCGVRFSRIDIPSFLGIDAVTLPLYQAASEAGGDYDGWETRVIKPPPT